MTMKHLIVLLPVLNEAQGLEWVLNNMPSKALSSRGYKTTIIVMDGGSTDESADVAGRYGVVFLRQEGKGKGAALRHGFRTAIARNADEVVMLDADGTYHPREMLHLLKGLNHTDVMIGNRLGGNIQEGAMSRFNFLGNHLLTWSATAMFGITTKDVCSGYWAFNRSSIDRLILNSTSFEIEAEMFASMVHRDVSFHFHPISYRRRIGVAKLNSTADGWRIFRKLLTRRLFPEALL